jgi:hypothetical protein
MSDGPLASETDRAELWFDRTATAGVTQGASYRRPAETTAAATAAAAAAAATATAVAAAGPQRQLQQGLFVDALLCAGVQSSRYCLKKHPP